MHEVAKTFVKALQEVGELRAEIAELRERLAHLETVQAEAHSTPVLDRLLESLHCAADDAEVLPIDIQTVTEDHLSAIFSDDD